MSKTKEEESDSFMRLLRDYNAVIKKDTWVRVMTPPDKVERQRNEDGDWHQVVTIHTSYSKPNETVKNVPVDLLFPASNNIEHHLGFRPNRSAQEAHRELLTDSTAGCFLVVKSSPDTSNATESATPAAASDKQEHHHLAIFDRVGEEHVIRGYEVSVENGTYTAKTKSNGIISNADFPVCRFTSV